MAHLWENIMRSKALLADINHASCTRQDHGGMNSSYEISYLRLRRFVAG